MLIAPSTNQAKHLWRLIKSRLQMGAVSAVLVLSACQPYNNPATAATASTAPKPARATASAPLAGNNDTDIAMKSYGLTIYGYNYTDTSLGNFSANGHGGGNLLVSGPGGGGGSSVCCFNFYTPVPKTKTVKIIWTRGRNGVSYECEMDVPLRGPIPAKPEYLEVHFYRDGHIELAATEESSPPRYRMERFSYGYRFADRKMNIQNDDAFAKCEIELEHGTDAYYQRREAKLEAESKANKIANDLLMDRINGK